MALRAEPGRDLVIETDLLDDDRRALLDLFLDKNVKDRIKLIVVSTGNAHLKAAELQQMVYGLNLKIKVVAGEATDVTTNPVTSFAGGVDNEGKWLLTQAQIERLTKPAVAKTSGKGAEVLKTLANQYAAEGNKLDVLLLTAPKVVGKYAAGNEDTAKKAFGNLFGMGFWKKNRDGSVVAPFNFRAGDVESQQLMEAYQKGVFDNFYHVRTDVVQNNSGLPGGFVPEDGALRNSLERAMNGNEFLRRSLDAAREYGLSWINWSVKNLGLGNTDSTRWVPSSWKSPSAAHGFYYADMAPSQLVKLPQAELDKLKTSRINHTPELHPPVGQAPVGTVSFKPGTREVIDVEEVDGLKALKEHIKLVLAARNIVPTDSRYNKSTDFVHVDPKDSELKAASLIRKRALVISFKNAPDDWMGLLHIVNTEEGRRALERGGVVVEGFQTEAVAKSVRAVLNELGMGKVSVALGHEYQPGEIDAIPNLQFERTIYEVGEGSKAFEHLEHTTPLAAMKPEELVDKALAWANREQGKVDAVILGEGVDVLKALAESPNGEGVGSLFLMGGGRPVDANDLSKGFVKTRNWLRKPAEIFSALGKLATHGVKSYVFSSDQFGGSMVAKTDRNLGNGEVMFAELDRLGIDSKVLGAIRDHWERWSRVNAFFGRRMQIKDEAERKALKFDPNAPVDLLTTSPIGLHIADTWVRGQLENGKETEIKGAKTNLEAYLSGGPKAGEEGSPNVVWLRRQNSRDIARLAARFGINLDLLVLNGLAHRLNNAVREHGPESPEAQELKSSLEEFMIGVPEVHLLKFQRKFESALKGCLLEFSNLAA